MNEVGSRNNLNAEWEMRVDRIATSDPEGLQISDCRLEGDGTENIRC